MLWATQANLVFSRLFLDELSLNLDVVLWIKGPPGRMWRSLVFVHHCSYLFVYCFLMVLGSLFFVVYMSSMCVCIMFSILCLSFFIDVRRFFGFIFDVFIEDNLFIDF